MAGVDLFEAFVKVVEHGSFARAADNFQISPAAMTKKINNLENSIGLRLLERNTRRVDLTESGEALFQQCLKIMQNLKDTAAIVEQLKGEPSGRLRILASLDFGERYVLPHLADFMAQHPKISSDLELTDQLTSFNLSDFDIAMGLTIEAPYDWHQGDLLTTQTITCASPFFLKKFSTPEKLDELINYPIITHQNRPDLFNFRKPPRVKLHSTFCFTSTHSMCMAATNHLGITQLPNYIAKPYIDSGRLIEILTDYASDPLTLKYAYNPDLFASKKSKLFLDFFQNNVFGNDN